MRRWRRVSIGLLGCTLLAGALAPPAAAIPYFARRYDVSCNLCHVQPPKLNGFGEDFRQRGYRFPGGLVRPTVPFAIWASGRSDAFPEAEEVRSAVSAYVNKLEIISGGRLVVPWLSYFVEWRPVSFETTTRDGVVGLRDRSGRFEDLFVTGTFGPFEVTLGQYRQIDQVDVSLRLGLSEPLSLAASLPGGGDGARQRSLRAFSPAGRSPAARAAWVQALPGGAEWTASLTVPVPGEFSIPLTGEARVEASNELELRAKGVVVETYARRGAASIGGHGFIGREGRYLLQGVAAGSAGPVHWTGIGGVERGDQAMRGRWSAEGIFAPGYHLALGGRVEDRAGDGAPPAFLPYGRAHFPGRRYTVYLAVEQRVQRDRHATLIELGTVF